MARFIFSMQNLLNMKEKLEDQAKNDYSQANLRLQIAMDELEALKARQKKVENELKEAMHNQLNVLEIKRLEDGVEVIKMYVKTQELVVLQRQKDVENARERLNEAMRERKTFEKLREKAYEQFLEEENIKERKEVDELVSYRYGVKASDVGRNL